MWIIRPSFVYDHWIVIAALLFLFCIQTIAAWIIYGKVTSFHTYLAKIAAVAQATFFVCFFFDFGVYPYLFFLAAGLTAIQLIEEIILVMMLPEWKANVKGLYWIWRSKRGSRNYHHQKIQSNP